MAEHSNFLIGYGERLASDMAAPLGGAPKQHPYTFAESRRRLTPKVKAAEESWKAFRACSAPETRPSL